ncbi:DUF447 domain-containing protein [Halopiger xanaduensis]|uniref:DUF447 family protein n=1 Tax=Halopiger xanaduensis (strain DSM 18323 / JCM 14033 / SH-6) TaxID=797210 RepID=F8D9W2_HALXS|nr:DUF447 domain-containing protein [Halopiger xanaduensis]AEH35739.1 protein of unknown function DUF447 [Halopiger xanaduensis SH-6]
MSDETAEGDEENGTSTTWPVELTGVTETVVTTLGPNGRWNAAALGVFAGDSDSSGDCSDNTDSRVTATTWGRTRTRGNFHREGEGYVQFVDDPVVFVDAALSILERDDPILESAAAWVRVAVEPIERGTENGTEWEKWELQPLAATVERTTVPTINRGFGAVVEATVAASRLDVPGYDEETLRDRLAYYDSVVERAGGPREREALERARAHSDADW